MSHDFPTSKHETRIEDVPPKRNRDFADLLHALFAVLVGAAVILFSIYLHGTTSGVESDVRSAGHVVSWLMDVPTSLLQQIAIVFITVSVLIQLLIAKEWLQSVVSAIALILGFAAIWGISALISGSGNDTLIMSMMSNGTSVGTGLLPDFYAAMASFLTVAGPRRTRSGTKWGWNILYTVAVLFVVLVGFARGISVLMQAPAEALDLTASYVRICGAGIFFIVAYNVLSAIFRGLGDSKSPLLFVLVACIVNVFGDLLLVAGLHLDAAGAAIATVAAQAVSVVCAVAMLLKKKKELQFKLQKSDFRLNAQCRKFLAIGLPLALQEFLTQMSFLALCAFVNRLGLEASSGYGVASKIVNFAMLIPSALMQSMASFVSQNIGAGNKKRARQSMLTGIGVGLAFGCAVFALVWCKGDVLCSAFTTEAGVIASGFAYLKGFAPETIATAVLFSMVGYFNGNDKTVWVMVQGLIQTLLVRLPMAYFMSIQPNASLTMIGLAAPTSTLVGVVLNIGFYLYLQRQERKAA